jgi:hypothetical protein
MAATVSKATSPEMVAPHQWAYKMNNNNKTLRQWAITSGESEDKAQRHRARLGIGIRYGVSWVLTPTEWRLVLSSMRSARRGNPNWIKM